MISVDSYREQLLTIRQGEMLWEAINAWCLRLHKEFEEAYQTTRLPVQLDYLKANAFLIHARENMVRFQG